MPATPFSSTHAVETWDTWFRWREGGRLRDVTIEDTWARVAAALADAAGAPRADRARELYAAMQGWRLLPDERLLASAGTGAAQRPLNDLGAAINVAAFVRAAGLAHATVDIAALQADAALAVFALDGSALRATPDTPPPSLRIGLIGVGDALHALGLDYDSDAACAQVSTVAAALARGTLAAATALARDGRRTLRPDAAWFERASARELGQEFIDAAARQGLAYANLTAIAPQQRLASFANRASDALDPVFDVPAAALSGTFDAARLLARSTARHATAPACVAAQLRLRAAAQPWIDAPIGYPVVCAGTPEGALQELWRAQALELGLTPPPWRLAAAEIRGNPLRSAAH